MVRAQVSVGTLSTPRHTSNAHIGLATDGNPRLGHTARRTSEEAVKALKNHLIL